MLLFINGKLLKQIWWAKDIDGIYSEGNEQNGCDSLKGQYSEKYDPVENNVFCENVVLSDYIVEITHVNDNHNHDT